METEDNKVSISKLETDVQWIKKILAEITTKMDDINKNLLSYKDKQQNDCSALRQYTKQDLQKLEDRISAIEALTNNLKTKMALLGSAIGLGVSFVFNLIAKHIMAN